MDERERERVRSVSKALEEIAGSASALAHEIKNPITAVNLALQAVARSLGEDETFVLRNLVERMQFLERRLRGALDYAKPIELERAPVDVGELLEAVSSGAARVDPADGPAPGVLVDAGCPPVSGDRDRLAEALGHLVENALEACSGGAGVRLTGAAGDAGGVSITVEDDGPGVPASVRARLFQPFATADADRVGLGLARCRRIVEAHGGSVELVTSPTGACFRIDLPPAGGARS
jgi:signal transduction histidine kinase